MPPEAAHIGDCKHSRTPDVSPYVDSIYEKPRPIILVGRTAHDYIVLWMDWLNFHHLMYFYLVVREGGVGRAAKLLRLSPQAVLTQIRALESQLDVTLFVKRGRRLVPTDVGRQVFVLAEDIYKTGQRVRRLTSAKELHSAAPLRLGVADGVPKVLIRQLVDRIWNRSPTTKVVVLEGTPAYLLKHLESSEYDAIVVDQSPTSRDHPALHSHLVMRSKISFFVSPAQLRKAHVGFPQILGELPMLLPTENSSIRRALDVWFKRLSLEPRVAAEIDDSEMINVMGAHQSAVFPALKELATEVKEQTGAIRVGDTDAAAVEYNFVTRSSEWTHPAASALISELPLTLKPILRPDWTCPELAETWMATKASVPVASEATELQ